MLLWHFPIRISWNSILITKWDIKWDTKSREVKITFLWNLLRVRFPSKKLFMKLINWEISNNQENYLLRDRITCSIKRKAISNKRKWWLLTVRCCKSETPRFESIWSKTNRTKRTTLQKSAPKRLWYHQGKNHDLLLRLKIKLISDHQQSFALQVALFINQCELIFWLKNKEDI